jgi:signal peptidase I
MLERHPLGAAVVRHIKAYPRIYGTVEAVAVAVLLALLIRAFVIEAYKIPSESMVPTLKKGDRLFVNKFIYRFREPQIGDVIVFRAPDIIYTKERPVYVKRVVGLAGDHVEIGDDGFLYVNGERIVSPAFFASHPYTRDVVHRDRTWEIFNGADVKDGEVLAFGDNSRNSYDGRAWGGVPLRNIKGCAMFRWWPPSRIGPIN